MGCKCSLGDEQSLILDLFGDSLLELGALKREIFNNFGYFPSIESSLVAFLLINIL